MTTYLDNGGTFGTGIAKDLVVARAAVPLALLLHIRFLAQRLVAVGAGEVDHVPGLFTRLHHVIRNVFVARRANRTKELQVVTLTIRLLILYHHAKRG